MSPLLILCVTFALCPHSPPGLSGFTVRKWTTAIYGCQVSDRIVGVDEMPGGGNRATYYDRTGCLVRTVKVPPHHRVVGVGKADELITARSAEVQKQVRGTFRFMTAFSEPERYIVFTGGVMRITPQQVVVWQPAGSNEILGFEFDALLTFDCSARILIEALPTSVNGQAGIEIATYDLTGAPTGPRRAVTIAGARLQGSPGQFGIVCPDDRHILLVLSTDRVPAPVRARVPLIRIPPTRSVERDVNEYGIYRVAVTSGQADLLAVVREHRFWKGEVAHGLEPARENLAVSASRRAVYLLGRNARVYRIPVPTS